MSEGFIPVRIVSSEGKVTHEIRYIGPEAVAHGRLHADLLLRAAASGLAAKVGSVFEGYVEVIVPPGYLPLSTCGHALSLEAAQTFASRLVQGYALLGEGLVAVSGDVFVHPETGQLVIVRFSGLHPCDRLPGFAGSVPPESEAGPIGTEAERVYVIAGLLKDVLPLDVLDRARSANPAHRPASLAGFGKQIEDEISGRREADVRRRVSAPPSVTRPPAVIPPVVIPRTAIVPAEIAPVVTAPAPSSAANHAEGPKAATPFAAHHIVSGQTVATPGALSPGPTAPPVGDPERIQSWRVPAIVASLLLVLVLATFVVARSLRPVSPEPPAPPPLAMLAAPAPPIIEEKENEDTGASAPVTPVASKGPAPKRGKSGPTGGRPTTKGVGAPLTMPTNSPRPKATRISKECLEKLGLSPSLATVENKETLCAELEKKLSGKRYNKSTRDNACGTTSSLESAVKVVEGMCAAR